MTGTVFEIKKFAVHDGDGIRTTVFLKGCSLSCKWCHNPEGLSAKPQMAYYEHKCISCGKCIAIQSCSCHTLTDGKHHFDNTDCKACGRCADVCSANALHLYGKEMTSEEVLGVLLEDKSFYDATGGGITLSGGECLCQADFCRELLKKCKENDLNTAVDTAGNVPRISFDKVFEYTDTFLYDLKHIDPVMHYEGTGSDNSLILDNLRYIAAKGADIEIRIPVIPGFNDDYIDEMGDFIKELQSVRCVRLLEYHNLAQSKYSSLQYDHKMPPVQSGLLDIAAQKLQNKGINVVM